ncbi:hypothetical protein SDA22_07460 [Legionella pneumophila serogroup 1]|uniref:hypothetical protein n=1 Tax=Legionella pneumophila TaxID=446 RepID=UPI00077099FB|nr:hypothetical protein [Legionella pneumophila]QIB23025.1 hypothetical protein GCO85_00995 [Legionella pneumophila]CZG78701.1 Uncharacterised protein [Legionella pneumophila]HAU0841028.1 hypothetical protein [Legionella pneumophila]
MRRVLLISCIEYVESISKSENWDHQLAPALNELLTQYDSWGGITKHFIKQFTSAVHFPERLWEMLLARKLHNSGLKFEIGGDNSPDFFIKEKNIWVEAVCPKPIGIPSEYLDFPPRLKNNNKIRTILVPSTEILLRWTQAIREKNTKAQKYFEKGVVTSSQGFIIALCCGQLGRLPDKLNGQSGYPLPVELGFGIGPLTASFDKIDPNLDRIYNPARPNIIKPSSSTCAEVDTAIFFDPNYNKIGAIIGAYSTLSEVLVVEQEKFAIAHNPNAINKIAHRLLANTTEYNLNKIGVNKFEITQLT